MNLTHELKEKLLNAQSVEEVAALVKADGQEITPEDAVHLWEEITHKREQDGIELSMDELETISGGSVAPERDWLMHGCASTVEMGSDCWNVDGGCYAYYYTYKHMPNTTCPKCGAQCYCEFDIDITDGFWCKGYHCKNCGFSVEVHYPERRK